MDNQMINSNSKGALLISALVLSALAGPQAQAVESKRVYTGLACQSHDPQVATLDLVSNTTVSSYGYFGSEITNELADPAGGFSDLGMNCTVDRSLFGINSRLKSVQVLLTDVSDPAIADDGGYCHTHIEWAAAGSINVIYGTDVYATDVGAGVYQTLTLPQTALAPTNDANYNIHCHVSGQWSSVNGYTVVEKN